MSKRAGTRIALASSVAAVMALAGCGAKTGLLVPEVDAAVDAFVPIDAPVDAFVPIDATIPPPDECIELPPREPPRFVDVSFLSRILSAEVFFLVDVTGSMEAEIDQIRARLRDTIVPGILEQIPDVRFSVGRFADYPVDPFGTPGPAGTRDDVFRLVQGSTSDVEAIVAAVDRLELQRGGDIPESTVEALYIAATGDHIGGLMPPRSCPAGTIGYPCFESSGSRIFLVFGDAAMHNGPGGAQPYGPGLEFRNVSYEEAVVELRAIGAKVIGLYSGDPDFDPEGRDHLQRVARDTGAVTPDGQPIFFDIGGDGASLGPDVVEAVRTLVEEVPIDVDALVLDWAGDTLDATEFVTGIEALRAEPPGGATRMGDRFLEVRPGTMVTFRIHLANERIERMAEPQRYRMTIILRGDGVTHLSETVVDVVIPAIDGTGCDEIVF